MGFVGSLLGIIGFGIGIPIGLVLGFFIFIYFEPIDLKDPLIKPFNVLDTSSLLDLLSEIPPWVKHPDYDRIDWLNKIISDMWPYLDKAICGIIRSSANPIFGEYVGKYQIKSIDFKNLSLGTLPPTVQGIKVHETNEKELVFETALKWAGNPNITLEFKLFHLPITVQLLDVQIFALPRIVLKPLVPTFPCFASIAVSLMEKPHVDFGLKLLGLDIMAIPGFYRFVQACRELDRMHVREYYFYLIFDIYVNRTYERIRKEVASLYHWPQTLEIPILDGSVGAMKKPVGILHVKVIRARKLLKMDLLGTSDPYVKLSLSGERLPSKKTSIKMKNLNPEWNEEFKLTVKDPQSQVLQLHVYDWEKVGTHDKLGMQVVPLRLLKPQGTKQFTLDLVKNTNPNDPQNKKNRGQLVVEMKFIPFREDRELFNGTLERFPGKESKANEETSSTGGGLLLVTVQGAEDVEGKRHNNPYALIIFRGEEKKTKIIKKTRDPCWNEEFQFVLEEPPLDEKIYIEVMSKRTGFGFRLKESLGHVDINLADVVYNGRINEKCYLINSKNGIVHVDIRWKVT